MKKILNLGNTMNQGTARGKILAFRIILIYLFAYFDTELMPVLFF